MTDFMSQAYDKERRTQKQFNKSTIRAYKDEPYLTEDVIDNVLFSPSRKNYTKKVVKLHARDNRGLNIMPKDMMEQGYLVLNSSYTQASNPCSMRDFGPPRNVIYNFPASSDKTKDDSEEQDKMTIFSTPSKNVSGNKMSTISSPSKISSKKYRGSDLDLQ